MWISHSWRYYRACIKKKQNMMRWWLWWWYSELSANIVHLVGDITIDCFSYYLIVPIIERFVHINYTLIFMATSSIRLNAFGIFMYDRFTHNGCQYKDRRARARASHTHLLESTPQISQSNECFICARCILCMLLVYRANYVYIRFLLVYRIIVRVTTS